MLGITAQKISVERRSTLSGAREAQGIVVVIDVLRAFTSAATMFSYGITELMLVDTVEEAFHLRARNPNYLLAGEVNGRNVAGFDLGNSPAEIMEKGKPYFRHRKVILRSTSGTQGALAVRHTATETIVTAYSTAAAVARYIKRKPTDDLVVTLLGMGMRAKEKSVEDERCADYIEHLLTNTGYDHAAAVWACLRDPVIAKSLRGARPYMPREDVILALQRDLFDFVMVAKPVSNSMAVSAVWT